jgi:hypothetical protein
MLRGLMRGNSKLDLFSVGMYILRRSRSVESIRIFGPIRLGPNAQILQLLWIY